MEQKKGRVTIPTNLDVVKETLDIMNEWVADAIRDCDGTEFTGAEGHWCENLLTYYTTRKTMPGQRLIRMRSSKCTL